MAISSELRLNGPYVCDGVVDEFPFTFKVFSAADVLVIYRPDNEAEQELIYITDYTVSLNSDQDLTPGGKITTTSLLDDAVIFLTSRQPFLQEASYQNSGRFYADSLNEVLDKIVIQTQQLKSEIDRSPKIPISGLGDINPNSAVFGVDSNGNPELRIIADMSEVLSTVSAFMVDFLESNNAAAARSHIVAAKSGANIDITSLNSPALGAATANSVSLPNDSNRVATTEVVNAIVAAAIAAIPPPPTPPDNLPVGSIIYVANNSAPTGFIKANGAEISRATYSDLFAVIGVIYGAGDGSTTFNIPDLRAEFIRGWDDGRGIDSGRVFGSFQADEFKSHSHLQYGGGSLSGASLSPGAAVRNYSQQTSTTGGTETRPRNIALLACIKY